MPSWPAPHRELLRHCLPPRLRCQDHRFRRHRCLPRAFQDCSSTFSFSTLLPMENPRSHSKPQTPSSAPRPLFVLKPTPHPLSASSSSCTIYSNHFIPSRTGSNFVLFDPCATPTALRFDDLSSSASIVSSFSSPPCSSPLPIHHDSQFGHPEPPTSPMLECSMVVVLTAAIVALCGPSRSFSSQLELLSPRLLSFLVPSIFSTNSTTHYPAAADYSPLPLSPHEPKEIPGSARGRSREK